MHIFGNNNLFYIGSLATVVSATFEVVGNDRSIIIGDDCMFSFDIDVSTSDRHVVFDFNDRAWLNEPASVLFEPHTWVGMHCNILKGSRTGFGSIIAASAVLAGDVPSCSIFGGIPAKLIRAECSWSRHEVFNGFDVEAVIAYQNLFESNSG